MLWNIILPSSSWPWRWRQYNPLKVMVTVYLLTEHNYQKTCTEQLIVAQNQSVVYVKEAAVFLALNVPMMWSNFFENVYLYALLYIFTYSVVMKNMTGIRKLIWMIFFQSSDNHGFRWGMYKIKPKHLTTNQFSID